MTALAVAVGGALGALARYGLGTWVRSMSGWAFPVGTMTVNLLGCLLLGLTVSWMDAVSLSQTARRFAVIGVLGAFTTFSTYTLETMILIEQRFWIRAAFYALGSLGLGVLAMMAGMGLGAMITQAKG